MEMILCGHATLPASKVIFDEYQTKENVIEYSSRSGILQALRRGKHIALDFPLDKYVIMHNSTNVLNAVGITDYICIVRSINTKSL